MPYKKGDEPVPSFRLEKLLGRGGFGEVWRVTAPGGVSAALKLINLTNEQGRKELRAIRLVKNIHHPNLVPTIGFWLKDEDGNIFSEESGEAVARGQASELIIAMGLGDKNLYDRLQECQKQGEAGIPAEELLDYLEAAAKAIDFLNQSAHDLGTGTPGIQHCDIKPQNILIIGGSAQVCDFGLARVLGENHHTQIGGTAFYTAPEVLNGNQPSRFTDQYSLAITYYHLLTGCLPFDAKVGTAAMLAHLQGKLDFGKVSDAEQSVLKRGAAFDAYKRFPTCLEMVRELRRAREKKKRDPNLIEPGLEIVPGYKAVRLIGKGGYGEVWEAVAPGGKHVALKVIRNLECPKGAQEFKSLETIKNIEHNHLIELHAYWILDKDGEVIPDESRDRDDAPIPGTLVIASRLAFKNLLDRLKECRKQGMPGIPLQELIYYMNQVAAAIDHLNAAQHPTPSGDQLIAIQHRDIKPENILLSKDNTVKLADFGLAKVLEGSSAIIHGSSAGLTPAYAAPELLMGQVTGRSDQYSLAITYFQLRTGMMPFPKGIPFNDLVLRHLHGELEFGALPEAERAIVMRAAAVKPEDRFTTCTEFVRSLQKAVGLPTTLDIFVPAPSSKELDLSPSPSPTPTPTPAGVTSKQSDSRQHKPTDPIPTPRPPSAPMPTPIPTPILASTPEMQSPTCTMPAKAPPAKPKEETDSEFLGNDTKSPAKPLAPAKPRSFEDLDDVSVKPTTIPTPGVDPSAAPIAASAAPPAVSAAKTLTKLVTEPKKPTQPAVEVAPPQEVNLDETLRPRTRLAPRPKAQKDAQPAAAAAAPPATKQVQKITRRVKLGPATLKIVVWVTVAGAVLVAATLGGVALKNKWHSDKLNAAREGIETQITAGEFEKAFEQLGQSPLPESEQGDLRNKLKSAWLTDAEGLKGKKQFEESLTAYDQIVRHFPDADAAKGAKDSIKGDWLAYVGKLKSSSPADAEDQIGKYLRVFPGEPQAVALREEIRGTRLTQLVDASIKSRDFDKAFQCLKDGGKTIKDAQRLQNDTVEAATQELQRLHQSKQFNESGKILDTLGQFLPGDPRLAELTRKFSRPDIGKLLARITDADKKLEANQANEALAAYTEIEKDATEPDQVARVIVGEARAFAYMNPPQLENARKKLGALAQPLAAIQSSKPGAAESIRAQKTAVELQATAAVPDQALQLLAQLKQGDLVSRLEPWERARVDETARAVVAKVSFDSLPKSGALEYADAALAFVPNHLPALLAKADGLRGKRDYDNCLATLKAASGLQGAESYRPRIQALEVLTWAEQSPRTIKFNDETWAAVNDTSRSNGDKWSADEKEKVAVLRRELGKEHLQELLQAASKSYATKNYADCRKALKTADGFKEFGDGPASEESRELLALADARDRSTTREAKQAAAAFLAGRMKLDSPRLADACEAYKTLADAGLVSAAELRSALTGAESVARGDAKTAIGKILKVLENKAAAEMAAAVQAAISRLEQDLLAAKPLTPEAVQQLYGVIANARAKSPPAEFDGPLASLEAILSARDENKYQLALTSIPKLLADPATPYYEQLCQELVGLARRDDRSWSLVRSELKKLEKRNLTPTQSQVVKESYGRLMADHVTLRIRAANIDWAALLDECKEADPKIPVVILARAEAKVEKDGQNLPEGDIRALERDVFAPGLLKSPDPAYVHYVHGLVWNLRGDAEKAANEFLDAYGAGEKERATIYVPFRVKRAVEVFVGASDALRERLPGQPFRNPFKGDSDAEKAKTAAQGFQWLDTAYEIQKSLKEEVPAALVRKLAVASWFRQPREDKLVRELAAVAVPLNNKVDVDDLLFLRLKGSALEDSNPDRALADYADLVGAIDRYQSQALENHISETDQLRYVVEPGIAVGRDKLKVTADSAETLRRALAKLYGTEARLIGRTAKYITQRGELTKACEKWLDAAEQAIRLVGKGDKQAVGYIVLRSYANMWLGRGSNAEYEQDAKAALELDPDYPGANLLHGIAVYEQGKADLAADRLDEGQRKVEAAYEALGKAIGQLQKAGDPYRELPPALMNRMNVAIRLANLNPEKWGSRLTKAIDDCDLGLSLLDPGDPDTASFLGGLGNILEDSVMLLTRAAPNYEKAVKVLRSAKEQSKLPRSWISLARCEYRALELSKYDPNPKFSGYPKEAERLLNQVVAADGATFSAAPTSKDRAEAYYWLGKLQALRRDYSNAESSFAKLIELGADAVDWRFLALKDAALLLLDRAQGNNPQDPQVKRAIDTARQYASAIADYDKKAEAPFVAARVRAKAFVTARDPVRALKVYEDSITDKDDLKKLDVIQLRLDKLALQLDERWRTQINAKRDKEIDPKEVAKEADAVLPTGKLFAETRGLAYGFAGLAHLALAGEDAAERNTAYKLLREAVAFTYPKEVEGWRWRFEFAKLSNYYAKDAKEDKKEFLESGDKYAREALKGDPPALARQEIENLLKDIAKQRSGGGD